MNGSETGSEKVARASRPPCSASSPNASSSGETPEDATGTVALPNPEESVFPRTSTVRIIGEPTTPNEAAQLAGDDKYQFQWWELGLVVARPVEKIIERGWITSGEKMPC